MINRRQSQHFTGIIRKLFVIFLIITFMLTAGSFILRHTITTKLDRLGGQLRQPWQQQAINRLLLDLNMTENSFRQASANGEPSDLEAYKKQLMNVFAKLGGIIDRYKTDGSTQIPKSKKQIARALQQKLAVSQQLFDLQKKFSSLLAQTTSGSIHNRSAKGFKGMNMQPDTSVSVYKEPTKRSLIKRLKDAVRNTSKVKVLTIKQQASQKKANIDSDQKALVSALGQQYNLLRDSNQEVILANLELLTELRRLLLDVQAIDRIAFEKSREEILAEYQSTSSDLNKFTGVASVFILLFIIILIVYIRKASGAERRYIMENSRAVRLAGQKSEILAIMSHEIRNKLMAINGAVFMLKRTTLLPDQEKKITSINLASTLLLETVNNVLDVSKMEQSASELNIALFSPYLAITDSVEAMRFIAEKKGIDLNLELEGIKGLSVNGDDLRLKQVLINLLSNAIKYTNKGYVHLSAKLEENVGSVLLTVSIRDTGVGIRKDKQAKLFSPYYQAGSQKPGTGLGLYLCRQLINLQGGTIELQSEEGQGCRVRFSIPYS